MRVFSAIWASFAELYAGLMRFSLGEQSTLIDFRFSFMTLYQAHIRIGALMVRAAEMALCHVVGGTGYLEDVNEQHNYDGSMGLEKRQKHIRYVPHYSLPSVMAS